MPGKIEAEPIIHRSHRNHALRIGIERGIIQLCLIIAYADLDGKGWSRYQCWRTYSTVCASGMPVLAMGTLAVSLTLA